MITDEDTRAEILDFFIESNDDEIEQKKKIEIKEENLELIKS